ncbi:lytic transglycosylase domain-containing protein [Candidatus Margulisiibacteriota bacterium]
MDIIPAIVILLLAVSIFSTGGQKEGTIAYREQIPLLKTTHKLPSQPRAVKHTSLKQLSTAKKTVPAIPPSPALKTPILTPAETIPKPITPVKLPYKAKVIYRHIIKSRKNVPDYEAELIANAIVHYSNENKIDPYLVCALIERESGFNARAVSKHGAKGLGQLMDFNLKPLKIDDPFSIEQAVRGTVTYLSGLNKRWQKKTNKTKLILASYLEGPNAIARNKCRWKKSTSRYISDILKTYDKLRKT